MLMACSLLAKISVSLTESEKTTYNFYWTRSNQFVSYSFLMFFLILKTKYLKVVRDFYYNTSEAETLHENIYFERNVGGHVQRT